MVCLFLCTPFSQLEGDVEAGVETQGFPLFMELTGDARTAGQRLLKKS